VQAEVGANLPLQMLLYYNMCFNLFTFPIWIAIVYHKMINIVYTSSISKYAEICCFCIYVPTECIRIYLGYSGNLLEKVPHLVGFSFLCILPQFPCLIVSTLATEHNLPFEEIIGILNLFLLLGQTYHAYYACRAAIRRQTAIFMRLCQDKKYV
ncbi:hypothetical protein THRCLA_01216, partial [Thraustotheca clavata]